MANLSGAKLDTNPNRAGIVLDQSSLGLASSQYFYDENYQPVTGTVNRQMLLNTPQKQIFSYTGQFTVSGNKFYMRTNNSSPGTDIWEVSNVSFGPDPEGRADPFSFTIEIDIKGNS